MSLTRRSLLLGFSSLLAGCATSPIVQPMSYAALPQEAFPLAAVPLDKIDPELRRQEVVYPTKHKPGTVIVDTPARRLYFILGNDRAIRYGVGVGRAGLALSGGATVGRKAEWPSWTPTPNMMRREEQPFHMCEYHHSNNPATKRAPMCFCRYSCHHQQRPPV